MNDENQLLVEARNVGITLRGKKILDNVSLKISRGEMITVIGPNGAGKTSLAKTLLGILPHDEGEIRRAKGLRIGYVSQNFAPPRGVPLSAERFMSLTSNLPPKDVDKALNEADAINLKRAQLADLSGGELQRAQIARALAREPDLLILDEPVGGVDIVGENRIYALIDRIFRQRKCGILTISHDLRMVLASSSFVICLQNRVLCRGQPERIRQNPEFRRIFGEQAELLAVYPHHRHSPEASPSST